MSRVIKIELILPEYETDGEAAYVIGRIAHSLLPNKLFCQQVSHVGIKFYGKEQTALEMGVVSLFQDGVDFADNSGL